MHAEHKLVLATFAATSTCGPGDCKSECAFGAPKCLRLGWTCAEHEPARPRGARQHKRGTRRLNGAPTHKARTTSTARPWSTETPCVSARGVAHNVPCKEPIVHVCAYAMGVGALCM